jgi:hypothetical protein
MNKIRLLQWNFIISITMFRPIMCGLFVICFGSQAFAQQVHRLNCQGRLFNVPAAIAGVREYKPIDRMGNGRVQFSGVVAAGGKQGRMTYQGYTHRAFDGVMENEEGALPISVLDNTGGRMIIYANKGPSMYAPDTIGTFSCTWR